MVEAQQQVNNLKTQVEKEGYPKQHVKNIEAFCQMGKMVIPKSPQHHTVAWFDHYLLHPGTKHRQETLWLSIYWKGQ